MRRADGRSPWPERIVNQTSRVRLGDELLSIEGCQKLLGVCLILLEAMPVGEDIEIDPPKMYLAAQPADFEGFFLLDAKAVSELRSRARADPHVRSWADNTPAEFPALAL